MRDFAWAKEELQSGERVQRAGWNGKGMFVALHPGFPNGAPVNVEIAEALGVKPGTVVKFAPYFMLKGTDGVIAAWTPSTVDLLAEDWQKFSTSQVAAPVPAEATTDSGDESDGGDVGDHGEDEEELDDDGVLDPAGSDGPDGDGPAPEPGSE